MFIKLRQTRQPSQPYLSERRHEAGGEPNQSWSEVIVSYISANSMLKGGTGGETGAVHCRGVGGGGIQVGIIICGESKALTLT